MHVLSRKEQVNEVIRCAKDPIYFLKKYVKIQHPIRGLVPFETYDFQDLCLDDFSKHRFNIVLKSRQLGLSTICAGFSVWMALFQQNKNILVIATKLPTAINFVKKVKVMLSSIPKWLLISSFEETTQSVTFKNGSTIKAIPTSEDAGRSEALSLLIVDEAAHIRNFEEIWTGIYPTLSEGGRAILLTTPKGVGGQFYKLWTEAEAGANPFNPIKLMWHVHPEHDQMWFEEQVRILGKKRAAQELTCDFLASGDTFLQAAEMDYLKELLGDFKRSDIDRNMWVWSDAIPNHRYVLSADVARGDANDYSAFHVIDVETMDIAAEYMGKIPPDRFADLLASVGKRYNDGIICCENNTFGWATNARLRDTGYPRLYYNNARGDVYNFKSMNPEALPGFSTQVNSRAVVLSKLEEAVRNKRLRPHSQRLIDQLHGFVWQGSKALALKDCNDDLVLSLAIGVWLIDCEICPPQKSSEMTISLIKGMSVERDRRYEHVFRDINSISVPNPRRADPWGPRQSPFGLNMDLRWLVR